MLFWKNMNRTNKAIQVKPYAEAVLLTASNVEELAAICENELQKLRGDVAGAYFDEFERKFKLQGKVALRGPRVGFVTAGGVDECIVRLEGAVKRFARSVTRKRSGCFQKKKSVTVAPEPAR